MLYIVGGCLGMEQLMKPFPASSMPRAAMPPAVCEADADYKTVCKGETGFRAVRVEYDPDR